MTGLRGLAFLFAVCLAGCTAQVEDEGCEDMTRQIIDQNTSLIEQWGASRRIVGPWRDGAAQMLLQHKPFKVKGRAGTHYCVPVAQSMMLSAIPSANAFGGGNYAFRWLLNIGGGGGSQLVKLDAINLQQVSVAAENVDVSLLAEQFEPGGAFVVPDDVFVSAAVSFADGNVTSGQATYTQGWRVAGGGTLSLFPVPFMATSLLIVGEDGGVADPFTASVRYQMGRASYLGNALKAGMYSNTFLEIPGGSNTMFIQNNGVPAATGAFIWGLDL